MRANLCHQPLRFLHFVPGIVLEILFAQLLNRAICCALWIAFLLIVFLLAFVLGSAALGAAHLVAKLFALFAGVQVFRQTLAFGWRQTHLALFAFGGPFRLLRFLI